jgi:hypothetical protein
MEFFEVSKNTDKLISLCAMWKRAKEHRVSTQNALKVAKQEDELAKKELDEIANELLVEMMSQEKYTVIFDDLTFPQGTGKHTVVDVKKAYHHLMENPHLISSERWDEKKQKTVYFFPVSADALNRLGLECFLINEEYPVLKTKGSD